MEKVNFLNDINKLDHGLHQYVLNVIIKYLAKDCIILYKIKTVKC